MPVNLPPPTICDMNCFYKPHHDGPHQWQDTLHNPSPDCACDYCKDCKQGVMKVATTKKDSIAMALENLAEAAHSLALHGAGGYTVDTSALDIVFVRSLYSLNQAIADSNDSDRYDPYGDVYNVLLGE